MAENANSALAVWNALKPKIRQLIQEEARSAVRRKKMTILSINTANQSVTVYEAANPNVTLTLQYRKESGVGAMSAGQGVMVEWTYDDLSTAVVSGPGQGWSTDTVDAATLDGKFSITTKTLTNQTTNGYGEIQLGLATSAAAVLATTTVGGNNFYICIPFVYNSNWYIRVLDNSGNRLASTNIGDITIYYFSL